MVPALTQGYAVVSTDGGHLGTAAPTSAPTRIARIDHAYNAYDKTAVNAKALDRPSAMAERPTARTSSAAPAAAGRA